VNPDPKVLVTGATGFLGRWAVEELLAAGWNVRVLARRADHPALEAWRGRVEVALGDVLDVPALTEALWGCTHALHAAAIVSFARRKRAEMMRVNVEGTANVVNVGLETEGFRRLILVSSVAALGRSHDGQRIDESQKWQDSPYNTDYGRSKHLAEREVFRGAVEGLEAQIACPCLILGSGDWNHGTPRLFRTVDRGLKYTPIGRNSVVGVWDVARALRLLLEAEPAPCRRYIVAERSMDYAELFAAIARALGHAPPTRRVPYWLAALGATVLESLPMFFGDEPPLTRQSARTTACRFEYVGDAFRRDFDFTYTPIEEVIERTAAAYLQERART
jgi:nucleoside-diphosphate-sugar epimerase